MTLKEYTEGTNLVLSGMNEAPASEGDMRCFLEAGIAADTAAEDFAYYRREQAEIAQRGYVPEPDGRILYTK